MAPTCDCILVRKAQDSYQQQLRCCKALFPSIPSETPSRRVFLSSLSSPGSFINASELSQSGVVKAAIALTWVLKRKRPRTVPSGSIPSAKVPIPTLHGLRRRPPNLFFAVPVAHVLQHGTGSLRATATELVIELVDADCVRTLFTGEGYRTSCSGRSVDCVHYAEYTCWPFCPS
jgi:hypothetical protein